MAKEKTTRTLFGRHGAMERTDAYQMIDNAKKSENIFRFVINMDPEKEDKPRDLDMRRIAESTMLKLEEIVGKTILWTAAIHADHTDKRHIHALAMSRQGSTRTTSILSSTKQQKRAASRGRSLTWSEPKKSGNGREERRSSGEGDADHLALEP